jgi:hypothetical protein
MRQVTPPRLSGKLVRAPMEACAPEGTSPYDNRRQLGQIKVGIVEDVYA